MDNVATVVYFGSLGDRIEGRYYCQKVATSPTVLILPPDPRDGKTMDDEIVKILEDVFRRCGFSTLAVNYQGSGRSEGHFSRALDGIVTASMALDWVQTHNSDSSHFWIAGYDFGAYVAADIATRRPEIENFVFISPLIKKYNFDFMSPALSDGLIIVGDEDEYLDQNQLSKLLAMMNESLKVTVSDVCIRGAKHDFSNKLTELGEEMERYVNFKLATRIAKPIRKKRRKRQKKENTSN